MATQNVPAEPSPAPAVDGIQAADDKFDTLYTPDKAAADATAVLTPSDGSTPAEAKPADATAEPAKDGGSTPQPAEAPQPTAATETDWLLKKFNGNRTEADKWAVEQNNRNAQLAKEKKDLEDRLAALEGSTPQAPQATQHQPAEQLGPELQRYDSLIQSVETGYKRLDGEHQKWSVELDKLDVIVAQCQRKLRSNDLSLNREEILGQLLEAEDAKAQTKNYLTHLKTQMDAHDARWQELQANRDTIKRTLDLERQLNEDRKAKEQAQDEAEQQKFRASWFGTIDRISKDASVIPAKHAERFTKYVKALGKAQVADGEPIMDVEKFIRDAATDFKGMLEAEAQDRIARYTTQKVADSTPQAPTGKAAVAPETKSPRKDWTPQQWEDYLENVKL